VVASIASAAGVSVQAAWWWLVAIVAVVAAVVALAITYFKQLKANSPEGKLEAANKAVDEAAEAADKAAESFDNLKNSLDSLDNKYNNLENLTKGTKEWQNAVKEVNKEVLQLITDYPELAGMFENVDGVLTIKAGAEEDVEKILTQKENTAIAANAAKAAAQAAAVEA
jgi:hypothetical protein